MFFETPSNFVYAEMTIRVALAAQIELYLNSRFCFNSLPELGPASPKLNLKIDRYSFARFKVKLGAG